jgi:hypothetical protein
MVERIRMISITLQKSFQNFGFNFKNLMTDQTIGDFHLVMVKIPKNFQKSYHFLSENFIFIFLTKIPYLVTGTTLVFLIFF